MSYKEKKQIPELETSVPSLDLNIQFAWTEWMEWDAVACSTHCIAAFLQT